MGHIQADEHSALNEHAPSVRKDVAWNFNEVQYEIPKGEEPKEEPASQPVKQRKEVKNVGTLRKKENGRWSIFADDDTELTELSSGSTIEVKIGEHWIMTGIEHNVDYYATTRGIILYKGMPARQGTT